MAAAEPTAEWPTDKLERRWRAFNSSRTRFAVLVTTGAMNPLHRGHVAMMELAKARLEQSEPGYCVLAGYVSPSSELYVGPKMKRLGQRLLTTGQRLRCVDLAVRDSDWLACGRWESARRHRAWPDFPDVCANLAATLARHFADKQLGSFAERVSLFYVCGEDHFAHVRPSLGCGVCVVPRSDAAIDDAAALRSECYVTAADPSVVDLSSTRLRQEMAQGRVPEDMVHPDVRGYLLGLL